MRTSLTYAAVTPARDEEDNLRRLAESMTQQTLRPAAWVIVENGSSDGTLTLARELAAQHSWISALQTAPASGYDRTSPYMRAFHAGVKALKGAGDLVVKLDADVSLPTAYFEGVARAFEVDDELGIASGTLFEECRGEWREVTLLSDHCWGPTRTYRRACLDAVLPLDDGYGYAVIDEAKARLAGFRIRTLRHLPFRHHRPEGAGEGSSWKNWRNQGVAAHYLGYRPSYLLARCAFRARARPEVLALLAGYAAAALRRSPRYDDGRVVAAVREHQRARHILTVVRRRASGDAVTT